MSSEAYKAHITAAKKIAESPQGKISRLPHPKWIKHSISLDYEPISEYPGENILSTPVEVGVEEEDLFIENLFGTVEDLLLTDALLEYVAASDEEEDEEEERDSSEMEYNSGHLSADREPSVRHFSFSIQY